jgi:nitroreductase
MELPVKQVVFLQGFERFYLKTKQCLDLLLLPIDNLFDLVSFFLNCRLSPFTSKNQKNTYDLIFFAHTIEKGLSLPEPRPLFGKSNISRILHLLRVSQPNSVGKVGVQMAIGSLKEYLEFHKKLGIEDVFLSDVESETSTLSRFHSIYDGGGTKNIEDITFKINDGVFKYSEFISSRYSCRNFQGKKIPKHIILKILETAQQAPSQCNRQSTRIHCYQSKDKIDKLLSLQGGSRGFSEKVYNLIVISNDLNAWVGRGERNQCYVDGGLFAMNLLLSIHANGLASCPLNFSKTYFAERKFKKMANIPRNERVVMLIAFGFPSEQNTIAARSIRSQVDQVLTFHENQ